jgi:SAM-dependent methyltransferase
LINQAKDALKAAVGSTVEFLLPQLGQEIDEGRSTDDAGPLKRAILHSRLRRAQSRGDEAAIELAFRDFWSGASGDKFHSSFAAARFKLFLENHAQVIAALDDFVGRSKAPFSHLVEIGCGDGAVLAYCLEKLPWAADAIGLDINEAVIAKAAAAPKPDRRLSFACADGGDWLRAHPRPGAVLIANGGVLEYLSQARFDDLLDALALAPPAALAFVEPVAPDHDLDRQTESYMFGTERSFSHNHRHRLEKAGFEVAFQEVGEIGGYPAMMMVAARL